jgi:hypothetical protein
MSGHARWVTPGTHPVTGANGVWLVKMRLLLAFGNLSTKVTHVWWVSDGTGHGHIAWHHGGNNGLETAVMAVGRAPVSAPA